MVGLHPFILMLAFRMIFLPTAVNQEGTAGAIVVVVPAATTTTTTTTTTAV